MKRKIAWVLAAAVSALGCSSGDGESVNLGENDPVKTGERLSDYAASWDGYVEAYEFPDSGSDRIRLVLDENGHGHLEFGDLPALTPPTDPDVGYPHEAGAERSVDALAGPLGDPLSEGFRYTVLDAAVNEQRIQLAVWEYELFEEWCELQTSVLLEPEDPERGYSCLPNGILRSRSQGDDTVCTLVTSSSEAETDCGKFVLCRNQACSCDAEGCVASPPPEPPDAPPTRLDAALQQEGNELVGTLLLSGERFNVRLTRQ